MNAPTEVRATCPHCGHDRFFEGPHGGRSVNVKCARCAACWSCVPGVPFDWQAIEDAGAYRGEPKSIAELAEPPEASAREWLTPSPGDYGAHAFKPWRGSAWRSSACGRGYKIENLSPAPEGAQRCPRCELTLMLGENEETKNLGVFHVDTAAEALDLLRSLPTRKT